MVLSFAQPHLPYQMSRVARWRQAAELSWHALRRRRARLYAESTEKAKRERDLCVASGKCRERPHRRYRLKGRTPATVFKGAVAA